MLQGSCFNNKITEAQGGEGSKGLDEPPFKLDFKKK